MKNLNARAANRANSVERIASGIVSNPPVIPSVADIAVTAPAGLPRARGVRSAQGVSESVPSAGISAAGLVSSAAPRASGVASSCCGVPPAASESAGTAAIGAGATASAGDIGSSGGASPDGPTAPDLSVTIAGVRLANPVIAASGTFGYGTEYSRIVDIASLGGICSKGLTLEAKPGNTGRRLVETPSGLINSIGLENPGIPHFIAHELPRMLGLGPVAIANLSGSTMETYVEGARLLDATAIPMIELNISCPNVKAGGMAWGLDEASAGTIVAAVRAATKKPLIVKLSPNAPFLVAVARAAVDSGADALSLVNTFQSFSVDIERARPAFDNVTAGLAGPAIKPIALRMVRDVMLGVPSCASGAVPVIGLGGIATWEDAVEYLMTGARAIQVGTATFANPRAMTEIVAGLAAFMARKGYRSIEDLRGLALR